MEVLAFRPSCNLEQLPPQQLSFIFSFPLSAHVHRISGDTFVVTVTPDRQHSLATSKAACYVPTQQDCGQRQPGSSSEHIAGTPTQVLETRYSIRKVSNVGPLTLTPEGTVHGEGEGVLVPLSSQETPSATTNGPHDLHAKEKNSLDASVVQEKKKAKPKRGHNRRVFYHSATCLPIHPQEEEGGEQVDSEGELDPEWWKVENSRMIEDFFDVNEGEKGVMKMWNLHVMHDNYVGDCHIPLACTRFVERYGHQIVKNNLYRNFILHLTNLFNFGLLPAPDFHTTVQSLHSQMKQNNSVTCLKGFWTLTPVVVPLPSTSSSDPQSTLLPSKGSEGRGCGAGRKRKL